MIYTTASNLFSTKERKMEVGESDISSSIEQVEAYDQNGTNNFTGEPKVRDSDTVDGWVAQEETGTRPLSVPAPNFELIALNGEKVRLSDFRGKKVLINFWATWCPPCVKEMPAMQAFYDEYAAKENIVIFAINATNQEATTDTVKQFVRKNGISFPILLDEQGDVLLHYEVLTLPTSLIIDEGGMVVEQILGPVTEEVLVEKLL